MRFWGWTKQTNSQALTYYLLTSFPDIPMLNVRNSPLQKCILIFQSLHWTRQILARLSSSISHQSYTVLLSYTQVTAPGDSQGQRYGSPSLLWARTGSCATVPQCGVRDSHSPRPLRSVSCNLKHHITHPSCFISEIWRGFLSFAT